MPILLLIIFFTVLCVLIEIGIFYLKKLDEKEREDS